MVAHRDGVDGRNWAVRALRAPADGEQRRATPLPLARVAARDCHRIPTFGEAADALTERMSSALTPRLGTPIG